ncbi:MAG: glycosyltransferase family 2 protein [Elusimicrobia bacterium]|nr:glycosyltransferase family 2 protein [Elusimicrobiota bacterium]
MPAELEIVIPVYHEGGNIIGVLEALRRQVKTSIEIFICYDHDDDNTLAALKSYQAGFPIRLVKNKGRGVHGAIMSGFEESRARAVMVLPADDDFNAGIYDSMMKKFHDGADIVCASRFMPGGCMEGCPWLKYVLVRVSAFALYNAGRLPTRDPSNGLRLFSRRVLETIPVESDQGFAFSIELLVKTHRLGWRIDEVPALWYERTKGNSRFRLFKWLPTYWRWFRYAFETTYFQRGPQTVALKKPLA